MQSSAKTNIAGQYSKPPTQTINHTTVYGSNANANASATQSFSNQQSQKALTHQIKQKDKIPKQPRITDAGQNALQIIEV